MPLGMACVLLTAAELQDSNVLNPKMLVEAMASVRRTIAHSFHPSLAAALYPEAVLRDELRHLEQTKPSVVFGFKRATAALRLCLLPLRGQDRSWKQLQAVLRPVVDQAQRLRLAPRRHVALNAVAWVAPLLERLLERQNKLGPTWPDYCSDWFHGQAELQQAFTQDEGSSEEETNPLQQGPPFDDWYPEGWYEVTRDILRLTVETVGKEQWQWAAWQEPAVRPGTSQPCEEGGEALAARGEEEDGRQRQGQGAADAGSGHWQPGGKRTLAGSDKARREADTGSPGGSGRGLPHQYRRKVAKRWQLWGQRTHAGGDKAR